MSNDAPYRPHMITAELHSLSGFFAWDCDCGRNGNGRTLAIVNPETPLAVQVKTLRLAQREVHGITQHHIDALTGYRVEHSTTEVA